MFYENATLSMSILLLVCLAQLSRGFLVKKRPKDIVDVAGQRLRGEHGGDVDHAHVRADPYGRLASWIQANARPYLPVRHPRSTLDVHVSAGLYQIVDLDQRNNLATVSAYFDVWWLDEYLLWNATEFGGLAKIFIPMKWIWKPEFYMYHSVYGRVPEYPSDAPAEIRSDGRVRMFVSISSKSFCPINFKRFPFDSQTCSFSCGSWTYQSDVVNFLVEKEEIDLGDFYDNQEWLLTDARLRNGTTRSLEQPNESVSMVSMRLSLKRQSFYYVFNLVFPTTLVSLVAVIGFHAPINATGRRESKFRLGIMTLLSMSVMLLMLVGEMKFAMESVPGQRGSFSDVPLLGIYYMSLIFIISIATCTSSIFVHLEKYALRNPTWQSVPWCLQWLAAKKLFCCYVPKAFRYSKNDVVRNNNVQAISVQSSPEHALMKNLIPNEVNFTEVNTDAPLHGEILLDAHPGASGKVDVIIALLREVITVKQTQHRNQQLRSFWERIIRRLETISLCGYLSLIAINITMFLYPEVWY